MIVGLGVDVTPIERIAGAIARHGARFLDRVFTDGERGLCDARRGAAAAECYAARFAAKEAAIKALAGPRGLRWRDLEVVRRPGQPPTLALYGRAAEAATAVGVTRMHLSLTHAGGVAVAVVVAESVSLGSGG